MRELFITFLQAPGRENYLAVHAAVAAADGYDPYSGDLDAAFTLVDQGKYDEARARLGRGMPNLLLSG